MKREEMPWINKARPAGFEQKPDVGCVAPQTLLDLKRLLCIHTEMRHLFPKHTPPWKGGP